MMQSKNYNFAILLLTNNLCVFLHQTKRIQASSKINKNTDLWSTIAFFTVVVIFYPLLKIKFINDIFDLLKCGCEKSLHTIYIFKSCVKFVFSFFFKHTICELHHSRITTVNSLGK